MPARGFNHQGSPARRLARFLAIFACIMPANADDPTATLKQAQRNAQLFDEICYANLPDLAPILELAKQNKWTAIKGPALKAYAPEVTPEKLKAWVFEDGGIKMRVSISVGPVDDHLKAELPTFKNAHAFACSLILPGLAAQKDMRAALQNLVGRPFDETYDQAPFKVEVWRGIAQDLAAMMYYFKPKSGAPGGLMSFIVLKNVTSGGAPPPQGPGNDRSFDRSLAAPH